MSLDPHALKERFGGDVMDGGRRWLGPGPGHSRRDRSLSVRITDDGRPLVFSFAGDPFDQCADYLGFARNPASWPKPQSVRRRQHAPIGGTSRPADPDPRALAIWREARPDGEVVATYLRSRGITVAAPPTLRQGVGLVLGRTPLPCLVAAVQAPDRRVIAIQRLWLAWTGKKAPLTLQRLTTGKLYDGAVRLAAHGPMLGLAEGVETALAAMQLAGVPCWASLGAERLGLVRIPADVRELHVFGDADPAGQSAAHKTAERHRRRGLRVVIRTPPDGLGDWADVLAAQSRPAA